MGTNNMNFLGPVYWGDSIKVDAKVTAKKETNKGWLCEYDWAIRNQNNIVVGEGHNI